MDSVTRMFSLEGQTAIVTGGTRGIGQAMAIALAEAGADIILIQVNDTYISGATLVGDAQKISNYQDRC